VVFEHDELVLKASTVNGKMVNISEVTEEHHEQMTEEEYAVYFEVLTAREG
jgi:hypothetical protein